MLDVDACVGGARYLEDGNGSLPGAVVDLAENSMTLAAKVDYSHVDRKSGDSWQFAQKRSVGEAAILTPMSVATNSDSLMSWAKSFNRHATLFPNKDLLKDQVHRSLAKPDSAS